MESRKRDSDSAYGGGGKRSANAAQLPHTYEMQHPQSPVNLRRPCMVSPTSPCLCEPQCYIYKPTSPCYCPCSPDTCKCSQHRASRNSY